MARLYIVYRIIDVLLNRTVVRMKAPPVRSLWGGRRSMGERPPGSSLLCTPRRAGLPVAPSSADRPPLWSGQARPPFSSPRPHGPPPPPRAGRGDGVLGGTARRTRWGGRRTGTGGPRSSRPLALRTRSPPGRGSRFEALRPRVRTHAERTDVWWYGPRRCPPLGGGRRHAVPRPPPALPPQDAVLPDSRTPASVDRVPGVPDAQGETEGRASGRADGSGRRQQRRFVE